MAHRMRLSPPLAALLLAAAAVAAGCGRGAAPPKPTTPLRLATYSAPLSLDPHYFNEVLTFSLLGNVFESLVTFDGQLRVIPALATSWENPSDLTWRFRLRQGVRFHDGRPLGADDVVASLERVRRHPKSALGNFLVGVESIVKVDEATVELTTARPLPILLNRLCSLFVVPRDAPAEITVPVGTGPYRFVALEPQRRLRLAAFDGYWAGAPVEREVEVRVVPDPAERVAQLLRGEVVLVNELGPEWVGEIERCAACRLAAAEGLAVEYLQVRMDLPRFSDLRVRRAINLALDRAALVEEQLRGQGAPIGQLVGRQVFGYAPDLEPPRRDLATARRLLAEAGLPDGFEVDLEHRQGRRADVIARQLGEAGIRVRPVARPWDEMYRRLQQREVPFYLGGVVAVSADASEVFDSKVHSHRPELAYGDTNSNRYANPAIDLLIEDSASTMDMLQRRQLLQTVMRRVMEDLPIIPLYVAFDLYGVHAGLRFEPRRDGMLRIADMQRHGAALPAAGAAER